VVRLEGENQDLALIFNSKWFKFRYQLKVEITEGPNQIQREDAKRRIVVGFNVRVRCTKYCKKITRKVEA
jgi:cobalt-zinc-cadmium resistance protein CzcA